MVEISKTENVGKTYQAGDCVCSDPFIPCQQKYADSACKVAAEQSRKNRDWNAAIEVAASIVDECNREGPYQAIGAAKRIRELKK